MFLRQFLPKILGDEADQSSMGSENDRTPTVPTHTLGRDSAKLPNKTQSSLTDTLGVVETSEVATPSYSKRPSGKFKFSTSHLCGFC